MKAGTRTITGRQAVDELVPSEGSIASLKNSLMPSARDCSQPFGPARFGPQRLPRRATALRSYMTMKRTEIISEDEDHQDLNDHDHPDLPSEPMQKERVPRVSGR